MNSRIIQSEVELILPMLYVPGNNIQISSILNGKNNLGVCNLAICLEDAVRKESRLEAEKSLLAAMQKVESCPRRIFIRPANLDSFNRILQSYPLHLISGFILPKATAKEIDQWISISKSKFTILPIMESREVLDPLARRELSLLCSLHRDVIPLARIGANDIFSLLGGLRRPTGKTIYQTPVGHVIDGLIEAFSANDVRLSAPVSDRISDMETFEREIKEDIERGLFGKTCVHPNQVLKVWRCYQPDASDISEALSILDPCNPAIFRIDGDMLEKTCHSQWARQLLLREKAYNFFESELSIKCNLSQTSLSL